MDVKARSWQFNPRGTMGVGQAGSMLRIAATPSLATLATQLLPPVIGAA